MQGRSLSAGKILMFREHTNGKRKCRDSARNSKLQSRKLRRLSFRKIKTENLKSAEREGVKAFSFFAHVNTQVETITGICRKGRNVWV